jgi:hypothetical protein
MPSCPACGVQLSDRDTLCDPSCTFTPADAPLGSPGSESTAITRSGARGGRTAGEDKESGVLKVMPSRCAIATAPAFTWMCSVSPILTERGSKVGFPRYSGGVGGSHTESPCGAHGRLQEREGGEERRGKGGRRGRERGGSKGNMCAVFASTVSVSAVCSLRHVAVGG